MQSDLQVVETSASIIRERQMQYKGTLKSMSCRYIRKLLQQGFQQRRPFTRVSIIGERQAATTNYPLSARIAHNDYRKLMTTVITEMRIVTTMMSRMPRMMPMIADRCRDRSGLSMGRTHIRPNQSAMRLCSVCNVTLLKTAMLLCVKLHI